MTKTELVNVALAKHSFVRSIAISFDYFKSFYNVKLVLSSHEGEYSSEVALIFYDVSDLNLKKFGGGLCQFMQLMILKLDSGLDRVRYKIFDIEREVIGFSFLSFDIVESRIG